MSSYFVVVRQFDGMVHYLGEFGLYVIKFQRARRFATRAEAEAAAPDTTVWEVR